MPPRSLLRTLLLIAAWLLGSGCGPLAGTAARDKERPTMSSSLPLIPRETLFGNPDKAALRVSPDGKRIAYLAPVNNVLNVWVAPADTPDAAKPVTRDTGRGIQMYFWAYTSQHLLYLQDEGGDENWKVHVVDLATDTSRDVTPFDTIPGPDGQPIRLPNGTPLRPAAQIENVSHHFPDAILVGLNTRDPRYHDLYQLNIRTGTLTLVQRNPDFAGFVTDDDYRVRFATRVTKDGGTEILKAAGSPAGPEGIRDWQPYETVSMEDALTTYPLGFDRSGRVLYMKDSRGRDTAAVTAVNLDTGSTHVLAADPRADASGGPSWTLPSRPTSTI
jgi:hypothetical protein